MANKIMLRKEVEAMKRKYRFDRFDIGSKCEPHTRKWILLLIFAIEMVIIFLLLNKIDAFFARYDWAKTGAFVILSLPIAFYLWMWRNRDKSIELEQKDMELKEEKRNAVLSFFNTCMEKIVDKNIPFAIRGSYLTSLEPYLLGENGFEYELQSLAFINEILKDRNSANIPIIIKFANSFNWYVQNGMFFLSEFHDMVLNNFTFSGISIKTTTFVNCEMSSCFFDGNFDKAMFIANNLSGSVFKNCDFGKAILTGCNLSECVFYECNIPSSFLPHSNISKVVLVNSTFLTIEEIEKREEEFYVIYTEDYKEKAFELKNKFPNAVFKMVKEIPAYCKEVNCAADIHKFDFTYCEAEQE